MKESIGLIQEDDSLVRLVFVEIFPNHRRLAVST